MGSFATTGNQLRNVSILLLQDKGALRLAAERADIGIVLVVDVTDILVAADWADIDFFASRVRCLWLILVEHGLQAYTVATFLASEDFHLVSNFIEASGADFVGNRLDLCLAVLLSFLHGAHEAPEVGRVFAVEYGVEAGVDGFIQMSDRLTLVIRGNAEEVEKTLFGENSTKVDR